ncbi:MAG: peptidylprolyl isomerase [Cytophagales bacterium]
MYKIISISLTLSVIATLGFAGDKTKSNANELPIITIANKPISVSEFKYVYNKNNANSPDAYSEKSIREYLELYVKFRLKVKEAEALGMDTTKSFNNELNGYKKQLAQPYLTEKSVTENLIKEAYDRLKDEVKASHILIRVAADADPKDTLTAFNKLMDINKKLMAGQDFETLAKEYSEDPSAKTNGGNLGYFTSLQMVYPFEDAAYKTPLGQVSKPLRTKFGYHLLKVYDKRKAQGEVKVAHIMIRYAGGTSPEDSVSAVSRINEIAKKLKEGQSWEVLCNEFSEDNNSKVKGGELPVFSTGNMIPSFEDAAFKLNAIGEVSAVSQTPYGFHLIKLIEKKPIAKYEEMLPTLKTKVSKDSRSDLSKIYLINRLKKENKFTENTKALTYAYSKADTNLTKAKFQYDKSLKTNNQTLFTIKGTKYKVIDFFEYLKAKQKNKGTATPSFYMSQLYKEYVNESLLAYEEANLNTKYEDYKMLVKEYRDGILLFSLMDTKVWTKAIEDTAGLRSFFSLNGEKYMWGKRAVATLYNCKDKATFELLKSKLGSKYYEVASEKEEKILYGKAASDLKGDAVKKADEIVNILGRDKNYVVELSASAEIGEVTTKTAPSKQRLEALVKYLGSKGIDKARILVKDEGLKKVTKGTNYKVVKVKYFSTSITALERSLNERQPLSLQIKENKFQKGDDAIVDSIDWKIGQTEINKNDRFYLVDIKEIIDPKMKTLDEAKGLVISDYQNFLEKNWVEGLKTKYVVSINEPEVQKLIKK